MCVIPWRAGKSGDGGTITWEGTAGKESTASEGDKATPLQEECAEDTVVHLLLIFGGMDMEGDVYRDCIVSLIE